MHALFYWLFLRGLIISLFGEGRGVYLNRGDDLVNRWGLLELASQGKIPCDLAPQKERPLGSFPPFWLTFDDVFWSHHPAQIAVMQVGSFNHSSDGCLKSLVLKWPETCNLIYIKGTQWAWIGQSLTRRAEYFTMNPAAEWRKASFEEIKGWWGQLWRCWRSFF